MSICQVSRRGCPSRSDAPPEVLVDPVCFPSLLPGVCVIAGERARPPTRRGHVYVRPIGTQEIKLPLEERGGQHTRGTQGETTEQHGHITVQIVPCGLRSLRWFLP